MFVAVLVLLVVFVGRLVQLQAVDPEGLAASGLSSRTTTIDLYASRGDIVDATGAVMATSVNRFDITADPAEIAKFKKYEDKELVAEGPAGAAALLAPVLGVDEAELAAKLTGDSRYVLIGKDVTPEVRNEVIAQGIPTVRSVTKFARSYPMANVGGNLLGFVSPDGTARGGLESSQNDQLTGTNGKQTYESGRKGQAIPQGENSTTPAQDGKTVHLTIVGDLQYMAQQAIDAKVAEHQAEWGAVIVMDNQTGDLLAVADSGEMDPNHAADYDVRDSRTVTSVFDPGSTAKIITMASALEEGIITPTSQFGVDYTYTTSNGQTFKDSHEHGHEQLTATGILAESSNAGTVQIGSQLTKQQRFDYLEKFGLGAKTGVGLPGESAGILHPVADWDGRTEYAVLFGQGMSVTAIQAVDVFATLGNKGVRMQPRLVDGYTDSNGVYTQVPIAPGTRVVSEQTAAESVKMLESVVDAESGTGNKASIPGYRVAGKTGTAQLPDGAGGLTATAASFVGVAPADNPRISVAVIVYKPTVGYYAGGSVAAPVFSEVAGAALHYLGVPPSGAASDLYPATW